MSGQPVDTVIVGAGSAGCVLAARLSEDASRRVLLLEAGPDHTLDALPEALRYLSRAIEWPYEWGDSVQSIRGRTLAYLRGRGVGGSSGTNGGVAMRAEPPDFALWPSGWQWDEMLPCFRRLENDLDFGAEPWHGAEGPIPVVRWQRSDWAPVPEAFYDACVAEGFPECPDHNAPDTTGVGPIPMNRQGLERMSASRRYLEPARTRSNLEVRGEAQVRRIRFEGKRAIGVELLDGEFIRAGEVILSAGVIQNPPLLLRSGVGAADAVREIGCELTAAVPAVGANLSDHFVVNFEAPIEPELAPRGAPLIQTILRATAKGSEKPHDLQLTPYVLPRGGSAGGMKLVISVSLQQPFGTGRVGATSVDAAKPAQIDWPWVGQPENLRRVGEGLRLAARIVQRAGICSEPETLAPWHERSDAELAQHVELEHQAFYHGVGTCRMGEPGQEDCVVDPDCRVRGTQGLYVVDASVVPTVPRSNTNILVMATAERAAERMR